MHIYYILLTSETVNFVASPHSITPKRGTTVPRSSAQQTTMFNPKNIEVPPTRERVAVESSTTKHTIVLKPGFQNRRNRSEYLKNSFPAGFLVKNKLTEKLGESILKDHLGAHRSNPYGSFTEWTKGEPEEPIDNVSLDLTDPYADVAGPFLEDMLRNRNMVQKPLPDNSNQFNSVVVRELPLHSRSQRHVQPKKSASNSPTKPLVYNAPALLPTFTPALGQNKINNNLLPVNPSEYEQWLSTQRSGIAEKAWLIKGNTEGFNYSAYEFGGERSPSLSLSTTGYEDASLHSHGGPLGNMLSIDTSSHPSSLSRAHAFTAPVSHSHQLTAVPAPLPERILLEVHTVNQMIRTDRLEEDKHIMRSIDSHVTLSELKGLITEDIIQGIERAFRLYSDSVPPSQRHQHTDYTRVELNFQCFVPLVGTWRAMATETDWTLAKQNCRNEQNVIKLMYALEKNSEFLLLKEIQQSYQKQRQKANLQAAPQISLQSLTETMEKNLRLKKKYVYDDSPPMTSHSTQRPTAGLNGAPAGSSQQLAASKSVNFLPQARSISMPSRSQGSSLDRNGSKSIHALLDSLNKSDPFREEHRLGHANGMNDSTYSNGGLNANSLLGGSSMYTSSVPSSASSAAGGVLGGSRSIFYPKRSHTLDKMYEELESSMPRQQNFANNLEQRLFKTRW